MQPIRFTAEDIDQDTPTTPGVTFGLEDIEESPETPDAPEAPDSPTIPGLVLEAGKTFLSDLNPIEAVKAFYESAQSPLGRWLGPAGAQVDLAKKMVVDPARAQLQKGLEAYRGGRYAEAAGHTAAALVPVVGPMAAQIGEQIATGDPREMARAVGHTASMAAPVALARAGAAMRARGAPQAPPPAAAPAPRTVTSDVPLTVAERTGRPSASFAEAIVERTIPGSGVYERFRSGQQAALQQAADDVVTRLSQTAATTPEGVGLATQKAIQEAKKSIQTQLSAEYAAIDAQAANIRVPTLTLKQAAAPLLKRLREESQLIAPQELARPRDILQRIAQAPKEVSFRAFQDARSDLLAITRSYGDPVPGKAAGVAKMLANETDAALMRAADQSGVPGLRQRLRDANARTAQLHESFNETVMSKLLDAAPEKVPAYVKAADLGDIRTLAATLPAEQMQTVRASIVRDMLNKATEGELAHMSIAQQAGLTAQGRPIATGPRLSGRSLRKQLESLGSEKLNTLLGADVARDLLQVAATAERISPRAATQARGLIAAGVNASIFSPILSPLGITTFTLPQVAGTYGLFHGVARLLVSQPGARQYRILTDAMARGDAAKATAAGLALTRMLEEEER